MRHSPRPTMTPLWDDLGRCSGCCAGRLPPTSRFCRPRPPCNNILGHPDKGGLPQCFQLTDIAREALQKNLITIPFQPSTTHPRPNPNPETLQRNKHTHPPNNKLAIGRGACSIKTAISLTYKVSTVGTEVIKQVRGVSADLVYSPQSCAGDIGHKRAPCLL